MLLQAYLEPVCDTRLRLQCLTLNGKMLAGGLIFVRNEQMPFPLASVRLLLSICEVLLCAPRCC